MATHRDLRVPFNELSSKQRLELIALCRRIRSEELPSSKRVKQKRNTKSLVANLSKADKKLLLDELLNQEEGNEE